MSRMQFTGAYNSDGSPGYKPYTSGNAKSNYRNGNALSGGGNRQSQGFGPNSFQQQSFAQSPFAAPPQFGNPEMYKSPTRVPYAPKPDSPYPTNQYDVPERNFQNGASFFRNQILGPIGDLIERDRSQAPQQSGNGLERLPFAPSESRQGGYRTLDYNRFRDGSQGGYRTLDYNRFRDGSQGGVVPLSASGSSPGQLPRYANKPEQGVPPGPSAPMPQYAAAPELGVPPQPSSTQSRSTPSISGVVGGAAGAGALGSLQGLLGTPQEQPGFEFGSNPGYIGGAATGGAYVRPPYAPRLFANSPVLRFGGDSVDSSVSPMRPSPTTPTQDALNDFNAEARRLAAQPREDLYKETSRIISEGVEAGRQQGITDANQSVNERLQARQGYYPTPGQRSSGFYARGMGPMAGDAELIERQNRPLGDGGPAAAAAKADQERRRIEGAAAMAESGQPSDGMTRYMPNQDLLAFANAYRQQEDQQKFGALQAAGLFPNPASGSNPAQASFARPALSAMTPDEIGFYRHKMNMLTNPAYKKRVESQRAEREEMLANRRAMVSARRQGALEAAGASQQLRNLMAGRGALSGQEGFNALMSMAAAQDANQAFNDYGPAYAAQMAPELLEKRAELDRVRQFDDMRRDIMTSNMSPTEQHRAMERLRAATLFDKDNGSTSFGLSPDSIPDWVNLPNTDQADPSAQTADLYVNWVRSVQSRPEYARLPPQQQQAILNAVRREYFPLLQESDILQHQQDNDSNVFMKYIGYPVQSWFGADSATVKRDEEKQRAYDGSISPTPPQAPPVEQKNQKSPISNSKGPQPAYYPRYR